MRRINSTFFLVVTALSAAGCSHNVIRSDHVEGCYTNPAASGAPCDHSIPVGLAYSLPKGQVLLASFRKPITAADAAKAAADYGSAQTAVSEANGKLKEALAAQAKNAIAKGETDAQKAQDKAAVAAAQASVAAAEALRDASKLNLAVVQSGLPKTPAQVKTAEDEMAKAQAQVDKDTEAYKKANTEKAKQQLEQDTEILDAKKQSVADIKATLKGKYLETFALTPQAIIPDDTKRYVANLDHSHWRDDTFKLSAVNGLLTSTNTTSTDQSANIISSLAIAAVGLITFIGAGIPVVPATQAAARPENVALHTPEPDAGCNYSFARVFDPTDSGE